MPHISSQTALPVVLVLGVFFIAWYLAGNELMRRRARVLAIWCKRALDPLGGKQAVLWITMHSFRLDVESARGTIDSGSLTGLVESWDVPMIWLANRLKGRRDMVLLQLTLRQQPIFGLELYRPGSLLAGDAHHLAEQERWSEEPVDEFRLASPGGQAPRLLAEQLLAELAAQRSQLIRLAVRRQGRHLTLALNVPGPTRPEPERFHQLMERLTRATLRYATPSSTGE